MKYLITESQLDKVIFKYLDNQDFIQFERNDSIYFVNSEGDRYPQIRYDKDDNWCVIYYGLVEEISAFFSMKGSDSKSLIIALVLLLCMKEHELPFLHFPIEKK